jgi:hypothetical protein
MLDLKNICVALEGWSFHVLSIEDYSLERLGYEKNLNGNK